MYFTYKNGTCNTPTAYDVTLMSFYVSQIVSTEFANSFYNCYLFSNSVQKVATTRLATFADFPDFYTSFLFNLLSQSLSVKTIATNINNFWTQGKWPEMCGEFAKLIRIIVDFDSSNAASLTSNSGSSSREPFVAPLKEGDLTFADKLIVKAFKTKPMLTQE
jgi:ABC-type uncharacterized transport system YnjBCD permease subunit